MLSLSCLYYCIIVLLMGDTLFFQIACTITKRIRYLGRQVLGSHLWKLIEKSSMATEIHPADQM